MALETYFRSPGEAKPAAGEKWDSFARELDAPPPPSGGFDCNICLDAVRDPVVTLCGHLFCWPCIYKWLHFRSLPSGNDADEGAAPAPPCPVCKAEVSQASLVPLYGRGGGHATKSKAPSVGIVVPRRPTFCGGEAPRTPGTPGSARAGSLPTPGSRGLTTSLLGPSVGIYGQMVYARVFGDEPAGLYAYPNTYRLAGETSPRVRRHVMLADESLSRVWFFLCCCAVLCLLLF